MSAPDQDQLSTLAQILMGAATLINGALLWPIVRSLKKLVIEDHGPRLTKLETRPIAPLTPEKPPRRKRKRVVL